MNLTETKRALVALDGELTEAERHTIERMVIADAREMVREIARLRALVASTNYEIKIMKKGLKCG